ncbi:MAG: hypothetical protein E7218_02325, partial [Anaerofustis stercorihominis]|nr:hypothetical protein [Anaerofustis stercorihominis]
MDIHSKDPLQFMGLFILNKKEENDMIKKLTAMLFCVLLLVGICAPVYAAEDSFVFVAVNANSVIIEPVKVHYDKDQTVQEALMNTEYEFVGIEQGFIYEIEGVPASFSAFCDDETVYSPLAAQAEDVSVVCYHVASEYSEDLCKLIIRMAEFRQMGSVTNYPDAKKAYEDGLTAIRTSDGAKEALDALNGAIEEYEKTINGQKFTVSVKAVKADETLSAPTVTLTDMYGNPTSVKGTSLDVIAGQYRFVVSDGGYNRTEGTLSVAGDTTLEVTLPATEWFGDIKLLDQNKEPYRFTQDKTKHTATYYVYDTAQELGSIYLNAGQADVPDVEKTKLRTMYIGTNGLDYSESTKSWESLSTALTYLVSQDMQGREFPLEAQYVDAKGHTQIQSYKMTIVRIPTLTELIVNAQGTLLPVTFDPAVNEYSFVTVSDNVDITAKAFGSDYKVSGCGNIGITSQEVSHKITVSAGGQTNTYTLNFKKVDSVPVTVKVPSGVNVNILNAAESEIAAVDGVYNLIAGEEYTLRSVKNTYYFAEKKFTASEGLEITAPTPNTGVWLTDIALYNNKNKTITYVSDKDFKSSEHKYTYSISDCNSTAYIQATAGDYTVNALYKSQTTLESTHNQPKNISVENKPVSETGLTQVLNNAVAKSGYSNEVILRVSKTDSDVTYYQDYIITLARKLHLYDFSVTVDKDLQDLLDKDGKALAFNRDVENYKIKVNRDKEIITLSGKFPNEFDTTSCCGGYSVYVGGKTYEQFENIEVSLDPTLDKEVIAITVRHKDVNSLPTVYYLTVEKTDPAYITFDTDPADTVIYLENTVSGKRVFGEGNVFALTPGVEYAYTITASGYIGTQGKYTAPSQNGTFELALEKAPENAKLEDLQSQWPHLRFNRSNNGVIDTATPIKDSEAMLYWATKIGDGYDKDACGCPILVDGYLYTYSASKLYKVDTVSGEILATADMDKASSYAINPPTYADGMLFIGLADGTVQAFNAATLESLWIYRDELGGQPNCAITYHNGFVYTGFWIGEMSKANYVCINATDEDPTNPKEEKVASWHYTSDGGFYWAGAYVCDEYMLIGTDDGESGYTRGYAELISFDTKTGRIIDQYQLPVVGDIRSSIVEYEGKFYFTNKGGYFFEATVNDDGTIASVRHLKLSNGSDNDATPAMSTCTPTIYNGRAYVGVSG